MNGKRNTANRGKQEPILYSQKASLGLKQIKCSPLFAQPARNIKLSDLPITVLLRRVEYSYMHGPIIAPFASVTISLFRVAEVPGVSCARKKQNSITSGELIVPAR